MKKIVSLAAFLLAITLPAFAQQASNQTLKKGQKAPALAFANPYGKTLTLKEVNEDAYVLIDFWASWCRPCRNASPKLVAFYDQYKDKPMKGAKNGIRILSVSLDQNKAAWEKAIITDKLSWPWHMSDLGGWQSKAAELYGVQFVPQAVLVGPDGKIIGCYMFAEEAVPVIEKLMAPQG